ncbi:Na+/H+ antiporter subunit E [Thermogladius sp. KZ2Tp1]|uniref:Na+/H+ antiporter subunit E n=1 Tax=Thermogladius sp. KZ2Tp1 TaxID=3136289 RepID=UPI003DA9369F
MFREVLVTLWLFLFYIVYTGSTTPYDIATGLAVAALVGVPASRLLVSDEKKLLQARRYIHLFYYALKYMTVIEFKAHMDVVKRVFTTRLNPGIAKIPVYAKSRYGRLLIAVSITNTPGTVVVDERDGWFYVNWIDVTSTKPEEARLAISAEFEDYAFKIFE